MKSNEIRKKFLDYFSSQEHKIIQSSSLIPTNDRSLLFTNSGMVQFKDAFLGVNKLPYNRAVSIQRCLRAGGKHNDLENVGYTTRHHTFFEMLGNFSFGAYFKHDAIRYAWTLLTEIFKLPKERLWVTVYHEDDIAYEIWEREIGIETQHIIKIGDNRGNRYISDNFWQMSDIGPCGPCSEVFYDRGLDFPGYPPGSSKDTEERYIELWNLVFMQFNRDSRGILTPLPNPCVDTGMGLERIAAVLQDVPSNYKTDIFQSLICAAARETDINDLENNSLKVIADHIRACSFLVFDGVVPSNEGRGYVLRRILRRAIRHGYKLGCKKPFFHHLVDDLVEEMFDFYPELVNLRSYIANVIHQEEKYFFKTIERGMLILEKAISKINVLNNGSQKDMQRQLDGCIAFKLHDTYGFPLDLTQEVCREHGLKVNQITFEIAMEQQRHRAQASGKFKRINNAEYKAQKTIFIGYESTVDEDAKVIALYVNEMMSHSIETGQEGTVILDRTPFYPESGGQIGDIGIIITERGRFLVENTTDLGKGVFGHHGKVIEGSIWIGNYAKSEINREFRIRITRNHSATHLLHKALLDLLGPHIQQKGALVNSECIRFDFSHCDPLSINDIIRIEKMVNAEILSNSAVQVCIMKLEDAIESGAIASFGEKYTKDVRVLHIGSSKELCGGTHVSRTGDIGLFKIISESGIASGIRRIEAITGEKSLFYLQELSKWRKEISNLFKVQTTEVVPHILQLQKRMRELEDTLTELRLKEASMYGDELLSDVVNVDGLRVLVGILNNVEAKFLRKIVDRLKEKLRRAAVVIISINQNKFNIIVSITSPDNNIIRANELVQFLSARLGGKGGGRSEIAQGGGEFVDQEKIKMALKDVPDWVRKHLCISK